MEEKNEDVFSPEELAIIKAFKSLKGAQLSTDNRLFVGDIPKKMRDWHKKIMECEADGEE